MALRECPTGPLVPPNAVTSHSIDFAHPILFICCSFGFLVFFCQYFVTPNTSSYFDCRFVALVPDSFYITSLSTTKPFHQNQITSHLSESPINSLLIHKVVFFYFATPNTCRPVHAPPLGSPNAPGTPPDILILSRHTFGKARDGSPIHLGCLIPSSLITSLFFSHLPPRPCAHREPRTRPPGTPPSHPHLATTHLPRGDGGGEGATGAAPAPHPPPRPRSKRHRPPITHRSFFPLSPIFNPFFEKTDLGLDPQASFSNPPSGVVVSKVPRSPGPDVSPPVI